MVATCDASEFPKLLSRSNKTGLCIACENGHASMVAFILTLDDTRMDEDEQEYDKARAVRGAFQCGRPQAAPALWDALANIDVALGSSTVWSSEHDRVSTGQGCRFIVGISL
jgi:hypothetical protein